MSVFIINLTEHCVVTDMKMEKGLEKTFGVHELDYEVQYEDRFQSSSS
jgi:hypothetical protein